MNKKEYAMLHYLLAKLKYELAVNSTHMQSLKAYRKNEALINNINEIEKLIIVGDERR